MKVLSRLLWLVLCLPLLAVGQAVISIEPAVIEAPPVGEEFTVDVNVTGGKNIASFQFTLTYDETALEFVEVKLGDYLPAGAFTVPAKVDAGSILYGASAIGATAAKANGTLVTLTFKVAAKKDSAVGFSSAKLGDAIAKEVASVSKGAVISAGDGIETGNNDSAKEGIPLLDVATISIEPVVIETPSVGVEFTVGVIITGGENVAGFQFTLTYDETALEFVEVKLGDYLPDANTYAMPALVDAGSLRYGASAIGAKADKSNGTLARVTFQVLQSKESEIGFKSAEISNPNAQTFAPATKGLVIPIGEIAPDPSIEETPLLVIGGQVMQIDGSLISRKIPVTVTSPTRSLTQTTTTGKNTEDGKYAVSFINTNQGQIVAKIGDIISFSSDAFVLTPNQHIITAQEIESRSVTVDLKIHLSPTLIGISPDKGSTKGNTLLTIKGTNFFSGVTKVKLGEQLALDIKVQSSNQLTCLTPANAAGLVAVEVYNSADNPIKIDKVFKYESPMTSIVQVMAEDEILTANGVSTTLITIKLLDQHSAPVADETVDLVTDLGTIPSIAKNLDNGTYTATYTAGRKSGTATITAVTNTTGVSGTVNLSLQPQKVSANKSTATLDRKWATIGIDHILLSVILVDLDGQPVIGQLVSVSLEPATDITLSSIKKTDQTGLTQVEIGSQSKGQRTITIKVAEVVLDAKPVINFTSDQVTQATVQLGGRRQVGQLVKVPIILSNEAELPISGKLATLIVTPELGVTITQPIQVSDTEGRLEAAILAETAGIKTLKVKVGETTFSKATAVIFEVGAVESVTVESEKASLLPEEATQLAITVSDKYLNPIKGSKVQLESSLGALTSATDNDDGTYQATFTAPPQTGKAILSATVQDKTATLVITITDQPPLTISPMTAEVEQGQTLQFKSSAPVLWISKGGIGTIDSETGLFTATELGIGTVTALLEENPTVKVNSHAITVIKAKLPATALVFELPKQVAFGAGLDLRGQLLVVDQPDNIAGNQSIVATFVTPQQQKLKFAPRTDSQGRYALDTVVKFNQVGVWQLSLNYAGSSQFAASQRQLAINVSQASAGVKFLSAESAELGQDYQLVGFLQPEVVAAELELQILGPDSRLIEQILITDTGGGFKHKFKLALDGRWSASVSWAGDDNYQAVTETFQLNVVKRFGKVIIALGGAGSSEEHAWSKLKSTVESVYQAFISRNFNPEKDIYFLSSDLPLTEGANGQTNLKTLEYAITNWAAKEVNHNVPLYIYLLSHNLGDQFLVERRGLQNDYLSSAQLDLWLDKLPEETPIMLIIEACYSGNFINQRLSAPNRTIITSASEDKRAMIMRSSSFTRFFFNRIRANDTIEQAFSQTKDKMKRLRAHESQSPQIDVNGNGIANELLDLRALKERRIPADISSLSLPPAFGQQIAAVTLEAGVNSHKLEVEVVGSQIDQVTAEIIQPNFDPNQANLDWQAIEQQVKLVELKMVEAKGSSSQYRFEYQGFDQLGDYTIIFQAKNVDGYAEPIQTTITVPAKGTQPLAQLTGDVNGDKVVNIFDLVIAAGQFGQAGNDLMGDVNGDGGVNIFDLVLVAGNFGRTALMAPAMTASIRLTTQQKKQIGLVIGQLSYQLDRSATEDTVLRLLRSILPDRLPTRTQLLANYPNPFNPETWIPFELEADRSVLIHIYNARGKLVRELDLGFRLAGKYHSMSEAAYWDGKNQQGQNVASGIYFYQLNSVSAYSRIRTNNRKMVILK